MLFLFMSACLSGCAGAPMVRALREQNIYVVGELTSIMNFLVGAGIIWYCWFQAKEKNRNPWIWSLWAGVSGVIALGVLVYLKKTPEKTSALEKKSDAGLERKK